MPSLVLLSGVSRSGQNIDLSDRTITFSASEAGIVDEQIRNFLELGIVEKTVHSCPEFVSNVFIRAKKDGSHRLILNLVHLNPCVEYHHFKMDTIAGYFLGIIRYGPMGPCH